MITTSTGQTKLNIPKFDPSTIDELWREDFVKLQNRLDNPNCYMTDRAAMALVCLMVSHKLNVSLSDLISSNKLEFTAPRYITYLVSEQVLTWQDSTWLSAYFKRAHNWKSYLNAEYYSDKKRKIIRESSQEIRDLLIKIYKQS